MLITTAEQWKSVYERIQSEPVFFHKVFVDHTGHSHATPTSSYHFLFNDGTYFCLASEHPDSTFRFDGQPDLSTAHKIISFNKKDMMRDGNGIDLSSILHLNGAQTPSIEQFYTPVIKQLKTQFRLPTINLSVPIVAWMEVCRNFLLYARELYEQYPDFENTDEFKFVNDITIPTLARIENAGMYVSTGQFLYTNYNIYTTTGRPSNAFGGINFAALNKSDGSRDKFVSRWGNDGTLVQFDYEAFHLRLAAHMMGYTLPSTSVHLWLAQQYFDTAEISDEQYEASKAKTFSIIYGQSMDTGGVDFFEKLQRFSRDLWNDYQRDGFIRSQTGRKIVVPDANQNKVFNYLMQLTETEQSISRIHDVFGLLNNGDGVYVILYTYDAILLDVRRSDLEKMPLVQSALESGVFPVRQYRGETYNNLILHKA